MSFRTNRWFRSRRLLDYKKFRKEPTDRDLWITIDVDYHTWCLGFSLSFYPPARGLDIEINLGPICSYLTSYRGNPTWEKSS